MATLIGRAGLLVSTAARALVDRHPAGAVLDSAAGMAAATGGVL
jgi:hypothetical protein